MDVQPGPLIGRGRAADVYAAGPGLVLRRYRSRHDVLREAAVMQHVRAAGFPVPELVEASGPDLVMQRVDGPTMLADLARRPWRARAHARTLAALHVRLAAVHAPAWLEAPFGEGDVVLHLDLHPDNVILTTAGPVVIDWTNARRGPAPVEVAHTWTLLATASPPKAIERILAATFRRVFLSTFLSGLDREGARPHIAVVARHRAADRNTLPAELRALERFVRRQAS